MQDLDLFLDGRVEHGGRLETIAQGLVIEHRPAGAHELGGIHAVPVVNQVTLRAHFEFQATTAAFCPSLGCRRQPRRKRAASADRLTLAVAGADYLELLCTAQPNTLTGRTS